MEFLFFASLYDYRWLAFGWPKIFGYFDIHADIHTSNLFYAIAYIETQMLALALMHSTTDDKIDFIGAKYLIDAFWSEPKNEDPTKLDNVLKKDTKKDGYAYTTIFGY